jgi:hypothetical protein
MFPITLLGHRELQRGELLMLQPLFLSNSKS